MSSTARRVAVVTGSNKGIGHAVVKALCKKFDGDVILCSRDVERGQVALKQLHDLGLNPVLHQLAIDDDSSILKLKEYLIAAYGGLDVLVNNAAIGMYQTLYLMSLSSNITFV